MTAQQPIKQRSSKLLLSNYHLFISLADNKQVFLLLHQATVKQRWLRHSDHVELLLSGQRWDSVNLHSQILKNWIYIW